MEITRTLGGASLRGAVKAEAMLGCAEKHRWLWDMGCGEKKADPIEVTDFLEVLYYFFPFVFKETR